MAVIENQTACIGLIGHICRIKTDKKHAGTARFKAANSNPIYRHSNLPTILNQEKP
jgi:hypothetical protein